MEPNVNPETGELMVDNGAACPTIVSKLCKIGLAVPAITTDKKHASGYRYASEKAIFEPLRQRFFENKLILFVSDVSTKLTYDWGATKHGAPIILYELWARVELRCGDTGETWSGLYYHPAADHDFKGVAQSRTSIARAFLSKVLMLPLEDGEQVHEQQQAGETRPARKAPPRQQAPKKQQQNGAPAGDADDPRKKLMAAYDRKAQEAEKLRVKLPDPPPKDATTEQWSKALNAAIELVRAAREAQGV